MISERHTHDGVLHSCVTSVYTDGCYRLRPERRCYAFLCLDCERKLGECMTSELDLDLCVDCRPKGSDV